MGGPRETKYRMQKDPNKEKLAPDGPRLQKQLLRMAPFANVCTNF